MMPMDMNKENKDVMDASQILEELKKLAESERGEGVAGAESDASLIDEAIASMEKFVGAEKGEMDKPDMPKPMIDKPMDSDMKPSDAVDTGILTGPRSGLKNFLVKKAQDKAE